MNTNNQNQTEKTASVFETLDKINVNDHTEKKGDLTYLSWAWAWREVKIHYPTATYTIYESPNGWNYWTDGHTAWVKTGVTIEGLEYIEYLPIMTQRKGERVLRSIPLDEITSMDVNKAIQRSLTKACARHGLGLYIYSGEDLPEVEKTEQKTPDKKAAPAQQKAAPAQQNTATETITTRTLSTHELYNKVQELTDGYARKHYGQKLFLAVLNLTGKSRFRDFTKEDLEKATVFIQNVEKEVM